MGHDHAKICNIQGLPMEGINLTDRCIEALLRAQSEAVFLGDPHVGTEHILAGLMTGSGSVGAQILEGLGVDSAVVRAFLDAVRSREVFHGQPRFTPAARRTVRMAVDEARSVAAPFVTTDHLFIALLRQPDCMACKILQDLGIGLTVFLEKLLAETAPPQTAEQEDMAPAAVAEEVVMALLDQVHRGLERTWLALCEGLDEADPWPLPPADQPVSQSWPVQKLVERILSRGILTNAQLMLMEPGDQHLLIQYFLPSGQKQRVEVPKVLNDLVPYSLMRLAHLNVLEKGRELAGELVVMHRGQAYLLKVGSEPIYRGMRLRIWFKQAA
ncbi:MAG: Clp protease N-terminal domain-containing protein [Candidatus Xenobia bacterium]